MAAVNSEAKDEVEKLKNGVNKLLSMALAYLANKVNGNAEKTAPKVDDKESGDEGDEVEEGTTAASTGKQFLASTDQLKEPKRRRRSLRRRRAVQQRNNPHHQE